MDTSQLIQLLIEYRFVIAGLIIMAWIIYALHYTGKLRMPSIRRPAVGPPPEQRLAAAEAEVQKLRREKERLTLTLAKMKKAIIEKEIKQAAEEKMRAILPEEVFLLDPQNQLIGRPIYYIGAVPVFNKQQELEKMIEDNPLAKIAPQAARKIYNWLYFQGDTLYFYDAILMPNGKWALTATSKPAKIAGNSFKLPHFTKKYVLLTAQQQNIDDIILNKWEVTHAKAAIILSSTVLGPFPIQELSGIIRQGWKT